MLVNDHNQERLYSIKSDDMGLKIGVVYGVRMEFILKYRMKGQKMSVPQFWAHCVRDGRKKRKKDHCHVIKI